MTFKENTAFLSALQQRVSHPRLESPAPNSDQMASCYRAAFRAPDHAWLRPWRFVECQGEQRLAMGSLIAEAMQQEQPDLTAAQVDKLVNGPQRAPLLIICYAHLTDHPKVPASEQLLATGCALYGLSLALRALGFGSVWRTGASCYSRAVHNKLGLREQDQLVGFLYVGTASAADKSVPELTQNDFVSQFGRP
ncbi:nitroreductase [Reinekea sp.]|uniref:nitroreductase family protein n=1 Tax=Reinekea sp. TaxID=1970455 RepID=UPI002A824D96|nr:nitroreductase [Reinekea sp.]